MDKDIQTHFTRCITARPCCRHHVTLCAPKRTHVQAYNQRLVVIKAHKYAFTIHGGCQGHIHDCMIRNMNCSLPLSIQGFLSLPLRASRPFSLCRASSIDILCMTISTRFQWCCTCAESESGSIVTKSSIFSDDNRLRALKRKASPRLVVCALVLGSAHFAWFASNSV